MFIEKGTGLYLELILGPIKLLEKGNKNKGEKEDTKNQFIQYSNTYKCSDCECC